MSTPFRYLIAIEPLGLLYGSAGAFLSPDNLVGRSGTKFPPSSATLSGIYAAANAAAGNSSQAIYDLQVAGSFWAKTRLPQNFYVPTPLNAIARDGRCWGLLQWHEGNDGTGSWRDRFGNPVAGKPDDRETWIAIDDWDKLEGPSEGEGMQLESCPWTAVPHLHPRLSHSQRHVEEAEGGGSLFLENGIQLHPDTCLVYLANLPLEPGWYRFGGEGHMVEIACHELSNENQARLTQPLGRSFATIVPSLWGSNRLSQRMPSAWGEEDCRALMTQRPHTFRYRLGGKGKTKRLSRGRYAVPAGTVYVTASDKDAWVDWKDDLFPKEGPYMSRWGCGLSLPLPAAVASAQ